jgi:molybdenum cofactor guanylyltransferase
VNCYVLTGGLSQRMGRPKSGLLLDGRTFFDRIVQSASGAFDSVLEVTRSGHAATGSVAAIQEPPHEGTSPLFGILASLRHAGGSAWIVATDYPMLTPEVLRHLRSRFESSAAAMLVPLWEGRPQLLCAGYASALVPEIERRIEQSEFRLRNLLARDDVEYVAQEELNRFGGDPLVNVNEPEEYERIRSAYGG